MPQERLQKILAKAGIASRRASEDLIRQGRVSVNGEPVEIGAKADAASDVIRVDGKLVEPAEAPVYIMLNKPKGIVSAASAQRQEKRETVLDIVDVPERVYPVGRLDADSEGLILLTNDGELTQRLTHPKYGHKKVYHVIVKGQAKPAAYEEWANGVELDDGMTKPCTVEIIDEKEHSTMLRITMREGRKRQIRRTAAALHLHVIRLVRVEIGPLKLGQLPAGESRPLTEEEVQNLTKKPGGNKGKKTYNRNKRNRRS